MRPGCCHQINGRTSSCLSLHLGTFYEPVFNEYKSFNKEEKKDFMLNILNQCITTGKSVSYIIQLKDKFIECCRNCFMAVYSTTHYHVFSTLKAMRRSPDPSSARVSMSSKPLTATKLPKFSVGEARDLVSEDILNDDGTR